MHIIAQLKMRFLEPGEDPPEGAVDYQVIKAYRYDDPNDDTGPYIYVKPGNYVFEGNTWRSLWTYGRVENKDAFMFARQVASNPECWFFISPTDSIVPESVPAFVAQIRDEALHAWTFEELRADTSPEAEAVKADFVDERRHIYVNTGTEEEPVWEDQGPDPGAERYALYRGIGTATADRMK